jgi:hypothetical protein
MLRHTGIKNAIPLDICDYVKNFFETRTDLHIVKPNNPNVVKINHPWQHLKDVLDPILSTYFKTNNGNGGNIYKHTNVYTTHVDSFEKHQMINMLMPIYVPDSKKQQHFVVFDQWVENGFGQTWYGDRSDIKKNGDFDFNSKTSMTPYNDSRVYNKTENDIDTDFYNLYLKEANHKPEYFKGLTGVAYEFNPGDLILFNSNQLHTTGMLASEWKMGLHINFDGSLDELLL